MFLMMMECQKMLSQSIGKEKMGYTVQDYQEEAYSGWPWMQTPLQTTSMKLYVANNLSNFLLIN